MSCMIWCRATRSPSLGGCATPAKRARKLRRYAASSRVSRDLLQLSLRPHIRWRGGVRQCSAGRGAQPVSPPPGSALAHPASLAHRRLHPSDCGASPPPVGGRSRCQRNMSPGPAVPCTARRHAKGPQAVACPGSPRGFLVGRRAARFRASSHLLAMEAVGHRVSTPMGLWGTPGGSHALRAQANQDTTGMGDGASRLAPPGAHPAAACAGP
jgi:hypothetical protein